MDAHAVASDCTDRVVWNESTLYAIGATGTTVRGPNVTWRVMRKGQLSNGGVPPAGGEMAADNTGGA